MSRCTVERNTGDTYGFLETNKNNNFQEDFLIKAFPCPIYAVQLNPDDFLQEEEFLKSYHLSNCPPTDFKGHELKTGYKTPGYLDLPKAIKLKSTCHTYSKIFMSRILGIEGDVKITSSWVNILEKNQNIPIHSHSNNIITGVYYLDVTQNTSITFHKKIPCSFSNFELDPADIITNLNSEFSIQKIKVPVKKGMLILYPSNLAHSVDKNEEEQKRWSLAFNALPIKLKNVLPF